MLMIEKMGYVVHIIKTFFVGNITPFIVSDCRIRIYGWKS